MLARLSLAAALTIGALLFVIGTRGESHAATAKTTVSTASAPSPTTTAVAPRAAPLSTDQTATTAPSTTARPPEGSPAREAQERASKTAPTTRPLPTTLPAVASPALNTSEPATTAAAAEGTPEREAAEGATGHVETEAERSSEKILGVNLEGAGIVSSFVILSIVLAGLVPIRRFRPVLWVATGFCILAAVADLHEMRTQIDRSESGLAAIAGTVAAVHVFGAIVGLVATRTTSATAPAGERT